MEFHTPAGRTLSLRTTLVMRLPFYDLRVNMHVEKDGHTYVVNYDFDSREIAQETVRAWAASPQVNLTWWDAAIICDTIAGEGAEVQL